MKLSNEILILEGVVASGLPGASVSIFGGLNDLDVFNYVWWGDESKISLQAQNGFYVSAYNGGGAWISVNKREVGEWEKFALYL